MNLKDLFIKLFSKLTQIKKNRQLFINVILFFAVIFLISSNINLKDRISGIEGEVYDVSEQVQSIRLEMGY